MAYEYTIGGEGTLFVGEDKTLRFHPLTPGATPDDPAVPVDVTGWTLRFDVRPTNASTTLLIEKTNDGNPGGITLLGTFNVVKALNTQRVIVSLTDDDMNLLKAKTYRWSIKRMDASVETVLGYGDFAPEKATVP